METACFPYFTVRQLWIPMSVLLSKNSDWKNWNRGGYSMVIRIVEFSSGGYKIRRIWRINVPKGDYWILRIGLMANCQKVGIILVTNKKCAPKLVFFNEKKMRKILMIFDIENWLWNSNFGTFWHSPLVQFSKFNNFIWL